MWRCAWKVKEKRNADWILYCLHSEQMRSQLGSRRRRLSPHRALIATAAFTVVGLLILTLRSVDPSTQLPITTSENVNAKPADTNLHSNHSDAQPLKTCATVEEMGEVFRSGFWKESYRVRKIIESHFAINGTIKLHFMLFYCYLFDLWTEVVLIFPWNYWKNCYMFGQLRNTNNCLFFYRCFESSSSSAGGVLQTWFRVGKSIRSRFW